MGPTDPATKATRITQWETEILPSIRADLNAIPPSNRHLPHPKALAECGYTSTPHARKTQLETHVSSLDTMNLLGAIANDLFDGKYHWIYQPVVHCRSEAAAKVLEQFFSRLMQTYSWTGGVNIAAAGGSCAATKNITSEDLADWYETINFAKAYENLEIAEERLGEAIRASIELEERDAAKSQLKGKQRELEEMRYEVRWSERELKGAQQEIENRVKNAVSKEADLSREMGAALKAMEDLNVLIESLEDLLAAELAKNDALGLHG